MMGRQVAKRERITSFSLEGFVPHDHLLRAIDSVLALGELRQQLAGFYSHTGRPSIDPELMIRMLVVGYCYGIRSERRLCEEVHLNLAYRWFCRLGLQGKVPEHSSFSRNRHGRFRDSEAFRQVFDLVLQRCMAAGLVGGEGFAIDASLIKADANRQRGTAGTWPDDWHDGDGPTRAVREYLAALQENNPTEPPPKALSLTDPAARWTAASGGPAFYAYSTNYLVDLQAGIIVDVQATPAHRPAEVHCTRLMLERVERRFGIKPARLVADTAYGTASLLGWLVENKQIAPHIPVWDKAERGDGTLGRSDFVFDTQHNCYRCPSGRTLHTTGQVTVDQTILYRANPADCGGCVFKPICCPNTGGRRIARSTQEPAREVARAIARTAAYRESCRHRKKVEVLFAHLKRILKLDRLRLRGLSGAQDEFLLAATVQNLRRLAMRTASVLIQRGDALA